jgi:thioredoxin reductase (NADPH)
MEKLIILGTGCAGLTAAIYAARANLAPLVLEGHEPGGQLSTTTMVENYPGFKEGIMGPELIMNMKAQAERFGARFEYKECTGLKRTENGLRIEVEGKWVDTRALIIASGASAKWLGIDRERELIGHGLTSCATCDGAFYRNVPVCVIGGGDSAAEEATFLTRFASKVYLIHRRDTLRASKVMAQRALDNPKIEPIWNTTVTEYLTDTDGEMRGVKLKNVNDGSERELEVKCVFVAIGHNPNTAPFKGVLEMDANGYLLQQNGTTATNVPGVYAAGDVSDHRYRQAVTASGQGCAAALDAERYLADQGIH